MNLHQSNFQKFYLLIPLLVFFCSSCGHKYYAPNDADLVVLKEKNDVHISGTTSIGQEDKEIYNVQLGYSPIKHLSIAGGYFKYNQWKKSQNPLIRGNEEIWNASIGGYFFHPLISTGISKRDSRRRKNIQKNQHLFHPAGMLVDIYLGRSIGSTFNLYQGDANTRLQFQKNYVQFGMHWTSKFFSLDFVTRVGKLHYSKANIFGILPSSSSNSIKYLENRNTFNLLEHSVRANFGFKHSRLVVSISGVSQDPKLNELGVVEAVATFGLIVDIDEFFRKEK